MYEVVMNKPVSPEQVLKDIHSITNIKLLPNGEVEFYLDGNPNPFSSHEFEQGSLMRNLLSIIEDTFWDQEQEENNYEDEDSI